MTLALSNGSLTLMFSKSVWSKIGIIGLLALLLLVPLFMIRGLIEERQARQNQVVQEISSKWGQKQIISGPVIVVPYTIYKIKNDKKIGQVKKAYFLPENLDLNGQLESKKLHRSIYETAVYQGKINIEGSFKPLNWRELGIAVQNINWQNAYILLGLSDMRGIKEKVSLQWDEQKLKVAPGNRGDYLTNLSLRNIKNTTTEKNSRHFALDAPELRPDKKIDSSNSGLNAKLPLNPNSASQKHQFSLTLNLKGSQGFYLVPVGATTKVNLQSNWPHPSFQGSFLPQERGISPSGFNAKWQILHLNRSYPQSWTGQTYSLGNSLFGVKYLIPINHYQKTVRSVKYALAIIILTFLVFFFIENLKKKSLHPVQYLLIGLALALFYTLLLALSEHLGFNLAYLIATLSTVSLIAWHTRALWQKKNFSLIPALSLALLYLFIYIILQLQDYALLVGTISLFIILGVVMNLSRRIDWELK